MDSLGIDNNTREIVWKITPQPKKNKKKPTKTTASKTVVASPTADVATLVEAQIKSLSGVLFDKIEGLEQEIKKLQAKNTALENKVTVQHNTYTNDAIFEPWHL